MALSYSRFARILTTPLPRNISIWFWNVSKYSARETSTDPVLQRANLPSNVKTPGSTIDTTGWGTPSAAYPSSSCNISQVFTAQKVYCALSCFRHPYSSTLAACPRHHPLWRLGWCSFGLQRDLQWWIDRTLRKPFHALHGTGN